MRTLKSMEEKYLLPSLELVEEVFTQHADAEEGKLVRALVAVKKALQRQHISKEMIEHGFRVAAQMGYKAVIVEGNPSNYNARGFVTSCDHGIVAAESVHLPAPECLMVKELVHGGLTGIHGEVSYDDFECLR